MASRILLATRLGQDKTWSFSTAAPPQGSQTANLNSVADAGLTELAPTNNNGAATTLKVDGDDPDPGGGDLYAALRWDLSQIPAGATVSNATVTLNISNPSPQTYGAYELKKAWNEGQLSWNQAATGTPWATAGAKGATDRGAQIASVTPTAIAPYTFTIPASVVQGWLSTPSSNNGILLANTTNFDGFVFDTKEGATAPKLTINYTTSGGGRTPHRRIRPSTQVPRARSTARPLRSPSPPMRRAPPSSVGWTAPPSAAAPRPRATPACPTAPTPSRCGLRMERATPTPPLLPEPGRLTPLRHRILRRRIRPSTQVPLVP